MSLVLAAFLTSVAQLDSEYLYGETAASPLGTKCHNDFLKKQDIFERSDFGEATQAIPENYETFEFAQCVSGWGLNAPSVALETHCDTNEELSKPPSDVLFERLEDSVMLRSLFKHPALNAMQLLQTEYFMLHRILTGIDRALYKYS